ncbi:MAG: ABC transporter permease, partial [Clostridia bacterium]
IPAILFFIVFSYIPMYGVTLAFKDFKITEGILGSPWAGLKYFRQVFSDPYFYKTIRNTIVISLYKLLFGFPAPIVFALLINELVGHRYKRIVQTVSYLPHFMSWVVVGGIFSSLLSFGWTCQFLLAATGMDKICSWVINSVFRGVLVATDIWKGFGWGSILYLAAIAGVDQEMYEASRIDGANKFQNAWYITIPSILPVICINLILSLSGILNAGFDQIFNMYSAVVYEVADIIDTYVYRLGLANMQYSLSTAVGLFKSVVGLIFILAVNSIIRRLGGRENSLW